MIVEDPYGNEIVIPASGAERSGRRRPPPPATEAPRCPAGSVYISGGTFKGKRIIAFCLDVHEVTVGALEAHLHSLEKNPEVTKSRVAEIRSNLRKIEWHDLGEPQANERAKRCTWNQRKTAPELPANCVSHEEAQKFCEAQGKRLPSEREWQWAARGGSKERTYPWGSGRPSPERLNMAHPDHDPQLAEVNAFEASPNGLHQLSGNVWEWTASDPASTTCKAKGGSFRSTDDKSVKVTAVLTANSRKARSDEVGFRCAVAARTKDRSR